MANIKIQNLLEKEDDEEGTRLNIKPDTSKGIRISTIMDDSEIDEFLYLPLEYKLSTCKECKNNRGLVWSGLKTDTK